MLMHKKKQQPITPLQAALDAKQAELKTAKDKLAQALHHDLATLTNTSSVAKQI